MNRKLLVSIFIVSFLLCGCFKNASSSSGSNTSTTSKEDSSIKTIEIYATNDIHGVVEEDYNYIGVPKLMTYLNEKGEQDNTLLLDQGDTWQGSIYSNYNHGEMITDIMNYIHYDARTIGNHDFDWGVQYVKSNAQREYNGYRTSVLAGNVYDYNFSTKQVGSVQQSELGGTSVTYTLENGLKVGILGCIGYSQITSITSLYTKDIAFTDHIRFIKSEATHLKNDEHCDVIIASVHTGQEDAMNNGLKDYVDLVLCGHSHQQESANEGNLYFVQGRANTQSLSHVTLTYDVSKKDVIETEIDWVTASRVKNEASVVDATIQNIVDQYSSECQAAAEEVIATNVSGSFSSSNQYPNLMCKAIYDECIAEGYDDVLLTYVNKARSSNYASTWKYADLYEAFPFDNNVYIAEITGREFMYEIANYNYIYRSPSFTNNTINPDATYKIATIDHLYFHTNENRDYNYFYQTGGTSNISLTKNYREILRDWLKANALNSSQPLNANNFTSSLWAHDRTLFSY